MLWQFWQVEVEKAQDKNSHGEADGIVEVICFTNGAQEQGESNKRKERKEAGELGKKIKWS